MRKYIAVIILFLVIPAFCQTTCDFNQDGINGSIADLIYWLNIYDCWYEGFYMCDLTICDFDEDGVPLTISDLLIFVNILRGSPEYNPDFSYHTEFDTLFIGSTVSSPGEYLSLPINLKAIDTLTALQFLIISDTNYITLDSIFINQNSNIYYSNCRGIIHGYSVNDNPSDSIFLLPGEYHLGDLIATVNSDIVNPVTTQIEFSGCPEDNFYTGLANLTFFQPVLINSEIQIIPTGINDDETVNLPASTTIKAYPNPFNNNVKITVSCPIESELVIYDLLGRVVKTFPVSCGKNFYTWDATDENGKSVNTGIYFIKIKGSLLTNVEKILYLK